MTVLPQYQIDDITKIMDYILLSEENPGKTSVGKIKKKFNLTNDEYNMIYDFCMPLIRKRDLQHSFWRKKYLNLRMRVAACIRKDKSELADKLRANLAADGKEDDISELEEVNMDEVNIAG